MILQPNCKINLGLHILCRRTDGYHEIETVFYPINDLCDELEIIPHEESSDRPIRAFIQEGIAIDCAAEDNICIKAYRLLKDAFPQQVKDVTLRLRKQIPFGAGLGGGSADAAYTLKGLNALFGLNLTNEQLKQYAVRIGADCAFFIDNKPAFAAGIGEQLRPIELDLSNYTIRIEKPDESVSTKEAYAGVKPRFPQGISGKRESELLTVIQSPIERWKGRLTNDFESSIFPKHPAIEIVKEKFYQQGAVYASMSGSGASVFGLFPK